MEVSPQSIAQRFVTRFHYLVFNVHLGVATGCVTQLTLDATYSLRMKILQD